MTIIKWYVTITMKNELGGLIMFEYVGYNEDNYDGVLLLFTNNGKRYSLLENYGELKESEWETNEQMNDEQFDQYWEDEGLDRVTQIIGEEIAYYLNDGEWNTDDLVLEN